MEQFYNALSLRCICLNALKVSRSTNTCCSDTGSGHETPEYPEKNVQWLKWVKITSRNPGSYLKNIINTLSGCSFVCLHLVFSYVFWCVPGFLSSFLSLCVKEMCRNAVFAHLTLYPKIFGHFHHQAYYKLTMACPPVGLLSSMIERCTWSSQRSSLKFFRFFFEHLGCSLYYNGHFHIFIHSSKYYSFYIF